MDDKFVIEVETTTPENPAKVLTNLWKAQEERAVPLFIARPDEDDAFRAERIEGILRPPVKELSNGETQLYTFDDPLGGQAGHDLPATRRRPPYHRRGGYTPVVDVYS